MYNNYRSTSFPWRSYTNYGGWWDQPWYLPRWMSGLPSPYWSDDYYTPEHNSSIAETEDKDRTITIDLQEKSNRVEHHTDLYEDERLIIRRGEPFVIRIEADKAFDDNEKIGLEFTVGRKPSVPKGTLIQVVATTDNVLDNNAWTANVTYKDENKVAEVRIQPSKNAIIGEYTLYVEQHPDTEDMTRKKHSQTFYVLFNAWCKEDAVYMEDEEERKEYCLREKGKIWKSGWRGPKGTSWNFNQLQKVCLETALYILDQSYLDVSKHGDIVEVTRALSHMVQSVGNPKGILVGNWSGDYEGGASPMSWTGSEAICAEYMENKQSVKFGQCWVFSGLTTTVSRALGIPCRSITNFDSAHDTDESITIDTVLDEDGDRIGALSDSVWNFHVWNEGWFIRRDCGPEYSGWQAYDATPQEASGGMMRCGPAPLVAIKEGIVNIGFDAPFIFSEVNGDRVTWERSKTGRFKIIGRDNKYVGSEIWTKAVGKSEGTNIVGLYKYKEGTDEERKSVETAASFSKEPEKMALVYKFVTPGQEVDFKGNIDPQDNGQVTFSLDMTNNGAQQLTIKVTFSVRERSSMGMLGRNIIEPIKNELKLDPKQSEQVNKELQPQSYYNEIPEDSSVAVFIYAKVMETGQIFQEEEVYQVDKPDIDIKLSTDKLKRGEKYSITLSFTNPLVIPLNRGRFRLEAPGIETSRIIPCPDVIGAGEKVEVTTELTPNRLGERDIIAVFFSRQLTNIFGELEDIEVEP